MGNIMLVLGWGSPIGTGIFLLCLAGMIFLLSKAAKKKEQIFIGCQPLYKHDILYILHSEQWINHD